MTIVIDASVVLAARLRKGPWCLQNAGMAVSITIRNVPDEARDELAARAARKGQSLQQYLRALLIEQANTKDIAAWVAAVREDRKAMTSFLSAEEILEAIHAERR